MKIYDSGAEVCANGDGQEYIAAASDARANGQVETEIYDSGSNVSA